MKIGIIEEAKSVHHLNVGTELYANLHPKRLCVVHAYETPC